VNELAIYRFPDIDAFWVHDVCAVTPDAHRKIRHVVMVKDLMTMVLLLKLEITVVKV